MKQNFKLRPLKGVKRKEKIEFHEKTLVFDILSFSGFVFFAKNTADFVGHTICPKIENRRIKFFPCVFHPLGQLL